jgi:hypothetical protein
LTQTDQQIDGFGSLDATKIHNLAGKYRQGYGTPFDLEDLIDSTDIDLNNITHVRIIDVVGSINPAYGTTDSQGNFINDLFPTPFFSGGFDLDAVGVIHEQNEVGLSAQDELVIAVYPNPSSGVVFIRSESEIFQVRLVDASGRVHEIQPVFLQSAYSFHAQVDQGLYLLQIETTHGAYSTKLMIISQ